MGVSPMCEWVVVVCLGEGEAGPERASTFNSWIVETSLVQASVGQGSRATRLRSSFLPFRQCKVMMPDEVWNKKMDIKQKRISEY